MVRGGGNEGELKGVGRGSLLLLLLLLVLAVVVAVAVAVVGLLVVNGCSLVSVCLLGVLLDICPSASDSICSSDRCLCWRSIFASSYLPLLIVSFALIPC